METEVATSCIQTGPPVEGGEQQLVIKPETQFFSVCEMCSYKDGIEIKDWPANDLPNLSHIP